MSRILYAVITGAGVKLLRDLTAERIDDSSTRMTQASRSVGKHRSTVHAFAAWLVGKKRLPATP